MSEAATIRRAGRPPAPVDPNTAGGRLQRLRLSNNMSQDDLAAVMGIDRSMISKYEDGRHAMGPSQLERAARRFDVTPTYILFGEQTVFAKRTAPIIGKVGAGAEIEAIEEANPRQVDIPAQWDDAEVYRVVGDSCFPIFEENDLLVVRGREVTPGRAEFLNRYCIVETENGLGYVKRVKPGLARTFTLESPNAEDLENVRIKRARPVLMRIIQGYR